MNNKHSDLIAIANAGLAKKLDSKASQEEVSQKNKPDEKAVRSFQDDIWKAVYTLNLFRYGFGILLLILTILPTLNIELNVIEAPLHPRLFFLSTNLLLFSAVLFSYLIKYQEISFNILVGVQFSLDVVLAALITYSTGSIDSNFSMLYILMVATGSVVLPRKLALGLAAGTIILMFFEHFYSILVTPTPLKANYPLLVKYALILFSAGWLISKLAARIHASEVQNFVPGNETIEDFLVREEKKALANALEQANGNKTEAAKLLGMTFRSFRYKLSKYDMS
jgi:hypothetical protein